MQISTKTAQLYVFALFLAGVVSVQGQMLRYNASTKQLYMRCPAQPIHNADVLFIALRRQHDDLPLANWTKTDNATVMYDRMKLQPASYPYLLEVVLEYVTCYDVTSYICSMIVNPHVGRAQMVNQSHPFTFKGEVTDPVLKVKPYRARYNVGDVIHLTCTARIGTVNNGIVWETALPGDSFTPVSADCEKRTNITEHNPTDPKASSCGMTSSSSLAHILTSDDDSRTWRCRLNSTNQNDVFVAAVQCPDGEGCSKPCRLSDQSAEGAGGITTERAPSQAQASATGMNEPTAMEEPPDTMLILIVIICVLFITMVISIVVMTTMLRKQTKNFKHLAPLTISPPPSDATYHFLPVSTDQTRRLPEVPSVDHYALHEDDLNLHNRDHHDTSRNLFSPATSSVYIPMSAIPSLHEQEGVCMDVLRQDEESSTRDTSSKSIYSNREAFERKATEASNGSTGSHDSHVTMGNLKGWK